MELKTNRPRISAVLGPTNTGKTHLAMERMLGQRSGMIGFPLRLLARENYDRAVAAKGADQVALITGEEKILPDNAKFFLCTVESMPMDRRVDFLGIDEIQMCADPDRGHIFTDRLLHARGQHETMFMGSEVVRPVLKRLVPDIEFINRPRFSTLSYSGEKKTHRLPARSAIVSFSANDVYASAELVKRHRGGAAVVLGALSPRTRNAQVEMFQSGEVDYIVATDAIGMGLNMDLDHVAFAATQKFDGRNLRDLMPHEMAQIAGRAGRHMNDGTFGTTAGIGPLDPEMVERIEGHRFKPLKIVYWRNTDLTFDNVETLKESLALAPDQPGLIRTREADDELALAALLDDTGIVDRCASAAAVELLWTVCRVPDFRKGFSGDHAQLLSRFFQLLMDHDGHLPEDFVAGQVNRLDDTNGSIDVLMERISHVRTWTYVAYQGGWLADASGWQDKTRAIEDKLSDALHDALTAQFVDKRTAHLMQQLSGDADMSAVVDEDGAVTVNGHFVGTLDGFRFRADRIGLDPEAKTITQAATKALRGEISARVAKIAEAKDEEFKLLSNGRIIWAGDAIAHLTKGVEALKPGLALFASDLLDAADHDKVLARLNTWFAAQMDTSLPSLIKTAGAEVSGAAKGILFQLRESLGSLPRKQVEDQIKVLTTEDRRSLRAAGLRLGRDRIYMPGLMKPAAVDMRGVLWLTYHVDEVKEGKTPPLPPAGRVSIMLGPGAYRAFYDAVGYRPFKTLAIRQDMAERLAEAAWKKAEEAKGPFKGDADLLSLAGCTVEELDEILEAFGFEAFGDPDEQGLKMFRRRRRRPADQGRKPKAQEGDGRAEGKPGKPKHKGKGRGKHPSKGRPNSGPKPEPKKEKPIDPDSPFAALASLLDKK